MSVELLAGLGHGDVAVLDLLRFIEDNQTPDMSTWSRLLITREVGPQCLVANDSDVSIGCPLPCSVSRRSMHDHCSQFRRPKRELSSPLLAQAAWDNEQGSFEFAAHAQDADGRGSLNRLAETHVVGKKNPVPIHERADAVELIWQELTGPIQHCIWAWEQGLQRHT